MVNFVPLQNEFLFKKIYELSNRQNFKVIELTQNKEMSITEIKKHLKLKYKRCSEYIKKLETLQLVQKSKQGKNVFVKSRVKINMDSIIFK